MPSPLLRPFSHRHRLVSTPKPERSLQIQIQPFGSFPSISRSRPNTQTPPNAPLQYLRCCAHPPSSTRAPGPLSIVPTALLLPTGPLHLLSHYWNTLLSPLLLTPLLYILTAQLPCHFFREALLDLLNEVKSPAISPPSTRARVALVLVATWHLRI